MSDRLGENGLTEQWVQWELNDRVGRIADFVNIPINFKFLMRNNSGL